MQYLLYLIISLVIQMDFLRKYGIIPLEYDVLLSHLNDYSYPRNKVSDLVKQGILIRLKKGLFVVSPEFSGETISKELIANHLYGPSYVSCEGALFYHGLIPERTYLVRSASTRRSKKYHTPVGNFEYISIPEHYFPIGIQQRVIKDSYAFLIAGPEKAICDQVLSTSGLRLQSLKAVHLYLFQDLRIDLESVSSLNPDIILECSETGYKKKELLFIYKLIKHG